MFRTILRQTTLLTACLPAVWLVLLALLVVRAHFTGSSYPMAKFAPFPFHFTITQIFFLAFPVLAIASIAQTVWVRRRFSDASERRAFIVLAISTLASMAVFVLNPGGYFLWFFDLPLCLTNPFKQRGMAVFVPLLGLRLLVP